MEAKKEMIITRIFHAPRELVFKAWSEAEHIAQWWGPKGFDLEVRKLEFRPGGIFHYCMRAQSGHEMWGIFKYLDIIAPERIVFTNSFSDKDGNLTYSPFHKTWPLEILNNLTLVEVDGKTTLTLRGGPINATDDEYKAFEDAMGGMQQGFSGTFEKLDVYLANMQSKS